jgi:hypothetical protein
MATINFKSKEIVRNYHLAMPYHELKPDEKKSLTKKIGLNDNLIIHGDKLEGEVAEKFIEWAKNEKSSFWK